MENIDCYKWNESIWTFIKMECVHIILSGLSTNLLLLTLYGLLRTFGLDLEGGGISIQRWLYQYISCYSKTISSSNTLNIDQGLFYHNTLVSRTTSHVKNGNGVKSVTIEDEIHSMKNLFLGGLARCRRWCGYSNHSGFNSENGNF